MINFDLQEERPELIQLCLNCTRPDCQGNCMAHEMLAAEIMPKRGNEIPKYTAFGMTRTVRQWCSIYGISSATLYARMAEGMTFEAAIQSGGTTKKRVPIRRYQWDGKWLTLREISERTGVVYSRLYDRLSRGWTLEDAVNVPRMKRGDYRKRIEEEVGNHEAGAGDSGGKP